MIRARLALLLALALAACAPTTDPEAAASGPADGGGAGGGGGCPDLSEAGDCRADTKEGGCAADEVCSVAPDPCGEGEACCTAAYACRRRSTGRPGGFSCSTADDCASGVCLSTGGVGVCLRACRPDGGAATGCPGDARCSLVPLDGRVTVWSCVGATQEGVQDAAATSCLSDDDCATGRSCQATHGEAYVTGGSFAVCRPVELETPIGRPCNEGAVEFEGMGPHGVLLSPACGTGAICYDLCEGMADVCLCDEAEYAADGCRRALRCTQPCRIDADCESPFVCSEPDDFFRIPTAFPDLLYGFCRLSPGMVPETVCFDESDCCKGGLQADGRPCCYGYTGGSPFCATDPVETTSCQLRFEGAPGKWNGRCTVPAGGLALGDPCTTHDACDSRLCAPDGAGGGRCSSVCDRGLDGCPSILPGSTCGTVAVTGPDGASVCVQGCVPAGSPPCG